ncbi:MAG: alpha/beta hydrolase [Candidatus Thiodiazotropha sp. (ex Notomyrtea botanica)]|nr:alpha/beta hydrolase [Candidatus Thiodiazotropha sp. (ex Notomyrtea botanica)]
MAENNECIILIPGIGGFPEFHRDLIVKLNGKDKRKVTTSPHGDSNAKPYYSLDQHVAYWSGFIKKEVEKGEGEVHLIGISFGAAIAISLPMDVLSGIKNIILVSPPHLPMFSRIILRVSRIFHSSITSKLLGKFILWWSERKVDDVELLREQRNQLYDDYSLVYVRLWNRLISLLDMSSLTEFIQNDLRPKVGIVYAKDEYAYALSPFNKFHVSFALNKAEHIVIPGDHSASIRMSNPLASAIDKLMGGTA